MVKRYDCLKILASGITDELVVANLGGATNEWHALCPRDSNLYLMGMGLVTATGLGLALALPHRRLLALEGDGSLLMGLSILPAVAKSRPKNLSIICFDNESYYAAGGYPTFTADTADLAGIAKGAGIKHVSSVDSLDHFQKALEAAQKEDGPHFLLVKSEKSDADVPYPSMQGVENKYHFVRYIERTEKVTILPAAVP